MHRKVGFIYAGAMVAVVATAFMIYRLFGGWGIFHWAALVSGLTLLGGMVPVLLQKPADWITLHFSFMYWSVVGLYAALVAESLARLPETPLMDATATATAGVFAMGGLGFALRRRRWKTFLALRPTSSRA